MSLAGGICPREALRFYHNQHIDSASSTEILHTENMAKCSSNCPCVLCWSSESRADRAKGIMASYSWLCSQSQHPLLYMSVISKALYQTRDDSHMGVILLTLPCSHPSDFKEGMFGLFFLTANFDWTFLKLMCSVTLGLFFSLRGLLFFSLKSRNKKCKCPTCLINSYIQTIIIHLCVYV